LEELAHRTKNDLAIIGSAITLQARASDNPQVRSALEEANTRVQVVAAAQSKLRATHKGTAVELDQLLEELCAGLGDLLRDVRPIAVRVHCRPTQVNESTAVSIGLIVTELVTNSFKHAFPSERGGIVQVSVKPGRDGAGLTIEVRDNGLGCDQPVDGLGTRLVRLLAKQRGGHFDRSSDSSGCIALAVVPDLS
jgi:two-component system, sensor histidine kinase PdtaS